MSHSADSTPFFRAAEMPETAEDVELEFTDEVEGIVSAATKAPDPCR
jgi:hypothetical protein